MAEGTTNLCHQRHIWNPCSIVSSLSAELRSWPKTYKEALHPETGHYFSFFLERRQNGKLDGRIELQKTPGMWPAVPAARPPVLAEFTHSAALPGAERL